MGDTDHFVQFYENEDYLLHSVSGFIGSALVRGDAAVMVAKRARRDAIDCALSDLGLDCDQLIAEGRFISLDAAQTLESLLVGGMPDEQRFHEVVGGMLSRLEKPGRRIRAFGEMVALLVESGNRQAAVRLEELWNDIAEKHRFALFCAYPVGADLDSVSLGAICRGHAGIIPGESISALDSPDERMRAIVELQHRTAALENELTRRSQVEQAFMRRLVRARGAPR
jgi:MEDS: MEthanogen/methylotroph, DcmR Sensory domain